MLVPEVVGFRLHGRLSEGATATDLVLTVTEMLRKKGVVGKFVEFYGSGLSTLSVPDRATIANMAPEYGATMGFFPVDGETLAYLQFTSRSAEQIALVEAYCKEQMLFRTDQTPSPLFNDTLELDLGTVEPTVAGPKRPQDRVALRQAKLSFTKVVEGTSAKHVAVRNNGDSFDLSSGAVVIAAITSCTNTSNPSLMLGAGLLAKKAVEHGLHVKPWVKTSLAPGSKVVTDYLQAAGLTPYLEKLNFHLVGYGCTTCIGNSGPLPEAIGSAIKDNNLIAVAVLSGNRNFEGRIHPLVRANYLASPPLVDRKSTRLNSSHGYISYAVFCLEKKKYLDATGVGIFTVELVAATLDFARSPAFATMSLPVERWRGLALEIASTHVLCRCISALA